MDIGGWSGAADAELSFLVKECIKSYPGATLWTALAATAEQMTMVATGDGLDKYHGAARGTFSNSLTPAVSLAFNAARQQQELITSPLFNAMNQLHIPIALLSTFGLLVCIGWGLVCKAFGSRLSCRFHPYLPSSAMPLSAGRCPGPMIAIKVESSGLLRW